LFVIPRLNEVFAKASRDEITYEYRYLAIVILLNYTRKNLKKL